jgi:glycosyltransferase involved in cell wall biosynthesis
MTISVVIPSIPPRSRLLMRALASVAAQTWCPDEIIVTIDREARGATWTRQHGLDMATGDWVAFLDDDDELLPQHLERLLACAEETGADMVFPWFTVVGGIDPFPQHFGRQWDPQDPTQTTITFLVRRQAAIDCGGFLEPDDDVDGEGHRAGEDFRFVCRLGEKHKIVHLPERTWRWHHHPSTPSTLGNTSGKPWRAQTAG